MLSCCNSKQPLASVISSNAEVSLLVAKVMPLLVPIFVRPVNGMLRGSVPR